MDRVTAVAEMPADHPSETPVDATPPAPEPDEIVLRRRPGWIAIDWSELYHARELLYFLIWRDVKIRYKQTVLGVAWAVLQPLLTMLIFTVIFGRFAGIPSDGVPYPLFVLAGILPWSFFSSGLTQGSQSLVSQQQFLTKIYLPRLLLPTAAVCGFLMDFLVSLAIYGAMLAFYGFTPHWGTVFLPALLALTVLATLGMSYVLAALTVLYRDFRYVIPFLVQVLMYLSPVIYSVNMLPARYRGLLALNPMVGIIGAYRWAILGTPFDFSLLGISVASALFLFLYGLFYFRKMERRFADIA